MVLRIRDSRCSSMISHLLSMCKAWGQLPALQKNKNIMLYQYPKGRDKRTAVNTRSAWSIQKVLGQPDLYSESLSKKIKKKHIQLFNKAEKYNLEGEVYT